MTRSFLIKLHDLCHEFMTHREEIMNDRRLHELLGYNLDIDILKWLSQLEEIHKRLHNLEMPESVATISGIEIRNSLSGISNQLAMMYVQMQSLSLGVDRAFRIIHNCDDGTDNTVVAYRKGATLTLQCSNSGCQEEWEIQEGWEFP